MLFRETAEDILKLYNRAKADHTDQNEIEGEIYIAAGEIESFDMVAEKIRDFHLNPSESTVSYPLRETPKKSARQSTKEQLISVLLSSPSTQ